MNRIPLLTVCLMLLLGVVSEACAELLSGQVLGPDGKPAPKAQVWIQKYERGEMQEYSAIPLDNAGAFRVELQPDSLFGSYFGRILVFQPGFAPAGGALKKGENIFRLQPTVPLIGKVFDAKNQPVAGVRVTLRWLTPENGPEYRQTVLLYGTPLQEKISAMSDANGVWRIDGGAENAQATVEILDPRFARVQETIVAGQETVSRLHPAATLSGRVVYEDGKPAGGVKIMAQAQDHSSNTASWSEDKSAADGTFKLASLGDGSYNILVDAPDEHWVAAAIEGAIGKSGETTNLPDLVLIKGTLIEGTITDEKGAPIPGAQIGSHGPHRPSSSAAVISASSDEKGFYRLRVAPGQNRIYVMGRPSGFLPPKTGSPSNTLDLQIENGQTKTVPFVLERGLTVTGTLKDRSGKPVAGVILSFRQVDGRNFHSTFGLQAESDEAGNWKISGLVPGKWKVDVGGEWETTSSVEIVLPRAESLSVRVQPLEYSTLRGRVVSFTGQPVAGASLRFNVSVPNGSYSSVSVHTVVSDEQGHYAIGNLRGVETVTFHSASKPGFRFSKGGALLKEPGKWDYTDIVMAQLSAKLAGRVLDSQKQPVANARVLSPDAELQAAVTTDAEGNFQLENLAQGFIEIIALHPEKGAITARPISNGSDIVLELVPFSPVPPQDMARAEEILREVSRSAGDANSMQQALLWRVLMPFDFERAVELATTADGKLSENFVSLAINFLSRNDPAKAATWGVPRLDEIQNDSRRSYATVRLGLAVADANPQLATELFDQLRATNPGEGFAAKVHLIYLAQLAAKLKLPEASALVDEALAAAPPESDESRGYGSMVAEAMAEADIAQARRVLALLQGNDKSNALRRVVGVLLRRGGKEEVDAALEILKLNEQGDQDLRFGFAGAAIQLIPVLGKTDPAAALAMARRVTESYYRPQALTEAALVQGDATSRVLLREAAGAALNHQAAVAQLAQIAILAHPRFPDLASEFTSQAQRLYDERKDEVGPGIISGTENDVQNLAIAVTQTDKTAARELLELEWIRANRKLKYPQNRGWQLNRIARAMANVDFERALQMAHAIPEGSGGMDYRYDSLRQLTRWILTAPEQRSQLWLNTGPDADDEIG